MTKWFTSLKCAGMQMEQEGQGHGCPYIICILKVRELQENSLG